MSTDSALVISLIVFTFAAVIVIAVVQWRKARKARARHEHSAMGDAPRPADAAGAVRRPPR